MPSWDEVITYKRFSDALTFNNYPQPSVAKHGHFIAGLSSGRGKISSRLEAALFLTNVIHESGGLTLTEEQNPSGRYSDPNDSEYNQDWSKVCKNMLSKYPNQTYHGRGYLQLSWIYNYHPASMDIYGNDKLCKEPKLVATDEKVAWDCAFWFWGTRVHHVPGVEQGDLNASINVINGAVENSNQRSHRHAIFSNVKRAFNI